MTRPSLIDSHCHLDLLEPPGQVAGFLGRAAGAQVDRVVTIGIDAETSAWAVDCAQKFGEVFATIGVHPHDAKTIDQKTYDQLRRLAKSPRVVAYGEVGLDFFRMHSPQGVQITRFHEQIELARELKLPLIIHSRQAMDETLQALEDTGGFERPGIFHCFPGDLTQARRIAEQGWLVSIPGTVTYKKATRQQQVARELDLNHLILETDAPFLTPEPLRGKPNEPAYVSLTADKVAELRGMDFTELAAATTANVERVLRLPRLEEA
jgi:TatD DNase family protein